MSGDKKRKAAVNRIGLKTVLREQEMHGNVMSTSRFSFCNIFGKRDVNESVLLLQHFGRMKPRALVFQRDVLKPHKKLVHISNFNMASAPLEFCAQEKN